MSEKIEPFCPCKLTDLIDKNLLRAIENGFTYLPDTGEKIVMTLVEKQGNKYIRIPDTTYLESWTDFCKFLRKNDKGNECCIRCDEAHVEELIKEKKKDPYYYICHAGLVDIVIPIVVGGQVLCGLFGGQKRLKDDPKFDENLEKSIEALASKTNLDKNYLLNLAKNTTEECTHKEIEPHINKLSTVARHIIQLANQKYQLMTELREQLFLDEILSYFAYGEEGEIQFSNEIGQEILKRLLEFTFTNYVMLLLEDPRQEDITYPALPLQEGNELFDEIEKLLRTLEVGYRAYRQEKLISIDQHEVLSELENILQISAIKLAFVRRIILSDKSRAIFLVLSQNLEQAKIFDQRSKDEKTTLLHRISERIKTQIGIYKINRLNEDFIDEATHRLRSPMQWVLSEVGPLEYYAKAKGTGDSKFGQRIVNIKDGVDFLDNLTESFLLSTTIGKERIECDLSKRHAIGPLLHRCAHRFKSVGETREIKIVFKPEVLPAIAWQKFHFNKRKIEIVFNNLIDNAIKYSHRNRDVIITVSRSYEGRFCYISISDFGLGILEKEKPLLFKKYYRARLMRDPRRNIGGTGIGLYVANMIVQAHRGNITIDSKRGENYCGPKGLPGEGYNTIITVGLPFRRKE